MIVASFQRLLLEALRDDPDTQMLASSPVVPTRQCPPPTDFLSMIVLSSGHRAEALWCPLSEPASTLGVAPTVIVQQT